ncbi:hypothetical protein ACJ41P_10365 [Azospirillum argentinense]|uniref:Uncharacterized protein n=1 Tax=Azospirillum argentinense TaxID=2970906 RepID=A0ABW8V8G1_9PROT
MKHPLGLHYISQEDVQRFLSARNCKPNCPVCDVNDWSVDSHMIGIIPVSSAVNPLSLHGPSLAVMHMICINCGFVRSHAWQLIANWLEEEGKANG